MGDMGGMGRMRNMGSMKNGEKTIKTEVGNVNRSGI